MRFGPADTTCQGVVQAYIERAKLKRRLHGSVTKDGAPIPPRPEDAAARPFEVSDQTVRASSCFPDLR